MRLSEWRHKLLKEVCTGWTVRVLALCRCSTVRPKVLETAVKFDGVTPTEAALWKLKDVIGAASCIALVGENVKPCLKHSLNYGKDNSGGQAKHEHSISSFQRSQ